MSKHEFTNSYGDTWRIGKTTPVPHHVEEVCVLVVLKAGHGVTPGTEEGALGLEAVSRGHNNGATYLSPTLSAKATKQQQ
jgi:hypothetical protein